MTNFFVYCRDEDGNTNHAILEDGEAGPTDSNDRLFKSESAAIEAGQKHKKACTQCAYFVTDKSEAGSY